MFESLNNGKPQANTKSSAMLEGPKGNRFPKGSRRTVASVANKDTNLLIVILVLRINKK
jgi:hypothetical protein